MGQGAPSTKKVDLLATGGIVAPSLTFGRQGNQNNAFLIQNNVVSDNTGIPIKTLNTQIVFVAVSNDNDTATFDVEIYEHDGTTFTLVASFTNTSARSTDYVPPSPINLTTDKELAVKITNGSATSPCVVIFATGDVPI
jgi:hypothetical protein